MKSRPESLAEVARRVAAGESFLGAVADFLDGFREAADESALAEAPMRLGDERERDRWKDAWLAAAADHLAGLHGLKRPAWRNDPERFLEEPRFACRTRSGRLFLLKDSPAAFKSRNLFVSANALDRV